MSMAEEEDKAAQLDVYKQQLGIVDAALQANPDNSELKDARADLIEVITLLQDVVAEQQAPLAVPAAVGGAPPLLPPAATAGAPAETLLPPAGAPAAAPPVVKKRGHEYIGRTCEVNLGGSWFNGGIVDIKRDERNRDLATIEIFGQAKVGVANSALLKTVKLSDIRLLKTLPPASCLPGAKVGGVLFSSLEKGRFKMKSPTFWKKRWHLNA